ncbi:hypothetical protein CARUB_v10003364mg [Capsella rubella]|uniref:F-box domain-containing protein n=1 Tax=Capsella rubella TaxID=81985 RepID=R0FJP5_9BRAS|nr:putative F-box/LRR-repeat protein 21 [Capsella rubella]EOA22662.1 hypothetical protein CARUB_v10003364mg [Capsella rubella]
MSSSSSMPLSALEPPLKKQGPRNWAELPSELTCDILGRLGAVEILESAQKVCTHWRRVCKDPWMWKKIDLRDLGNREKGDLDFDILCRHAVDLSQGGLLEIHLESFATDSLLTYIADRSRDLRSLGLGIYFSYTTNRGLVSALAKLPLLETLEISHTCLSLNLKAIGKACPQLKTFTLNSSGSGYDGFEEFGYSPPLVNGDDDYADDDDYALAIAESMPKLRHLKLLGDRLTDDGLKAILNGCLQLEHLDLRKGFNINFEEDLLKKCLERIKEFRHPNASPDDYPYELTFVVSDFDSSSDDGSDDDYYYLEI